MSEPRLALITGGAQGIGAAIARALHARGHRIAIADIDLARAEALARELGGVAVRLDVRSKEDFAALGPVDILVSNAALTRAQPFQSITQEDWDGLMAINLRGFLFAVQQVAPGMQARGWGRILSLTSIAGQRGGAQVQGVHYVASKAGLLGMMRYFAYELAPYGITVNAIAPGPTVTAQTALVPPERIAALTAQIPVGRLGTADEIGALAAYLASDEAGFVTGATFDINGGLLMR